MTVIITKSVVPDVTYPKRISFRSAKGKQAVIEVWPYRGVWLWNALGNTGEAETERQAFSDAERWVKG